MKKNTLYLNLNILAVSFLLLFGCSKSTNDTEITADTRITAAGTSTSPHLVVISNSTFNPVRMQVVVGTTVTWVNQDNIVHTVSSYDDSFDSGDIQPGSTFSYTPVEPGTRPYHCKYHDKMAGELVAGMIK
jgi:plastocyanin